MTKPTDETVDLDQLLAAAITEHSPKEPAPPAAESAETDDTKTGEEQEGKPAEAPGPEPAETDGAKDTLLSEDEAKEIEKDPKAAELYKRLNRAYTQKTQALSALKKETLAEKQAAEKLRGYAEFIEAFESDPKTILRRLGVQYGLIDSEPKKEPASKEEFPKSPPPPKGLSKDEIASRFKKAFGEEYEDFSVVLGDVLHELLGQQQKPEPPPDLGKITSRLDSLEAEKTMARVHQDIDALTVRHKDWKAHEPAMLEVMRKIGNAPGLNAEEYLDLVYDLATKNQQKAATTKTVIEKIKRSAAANEPPSRTGVNPTLVKVASDKAISLDDAIEMALRGEVVED